MGGAEVGGGDGDGVGDARRGTPKPQDVWTCVGFALVGVCKVLKKNGVSDWLNEWMNKRTNERTKP